MARLIALAAAVTLLTLAARPCTAQPDRTFAIQGRVVYSGGPLPPKMHVMVYTPGRYGTDGQGIELLPDGRFTASGLSPGTYLLEAVPVVDGPDDRPSGFERGFLLQTIKDDDVRDVVIVTRPGVKVRGRVRFDESFAGVSRPMRIVVHLALVPADFLGPLESAPVADDGTFELLDITGPRVFRFGWQRTDRGYWAPGPVLLDDRDITNVPVDFSREPAGDLVVVFRQRTSAIVGRVEDVAGLPAAACIAMLPDDAELRHGWSTAVDMFEVDDRGRFYFTNMPPGDYYVTALDEPACPLPHELVGDTRQPSARATRTTVTGTATVRVVVTTGTTAPQP